MKKNRTIQVGIDKIVHGGQGLGVDESGKKVFVWGALPGEVVLVSFTKQKKDYSEGMALEIIKPSPCRIRPTEPDIYLATSPWQIVDYSQEAIYKQQILAESFAREKIDIKWQDFFQGAQEYGYRNKMEYNFWFDKETERVSLALHKRGTHQKIAVSGSILASDTINSAGRNLVEYINSKKIEGRSLKSVIIRSTQHGQVGISLFIKDKAVASEFSDFTMPKLSFEVVYSDPKSPASVATQVLSINNIILKDNLCGNVFAYTNRSFFQVNIPVYNLVLNIIKEYLNSINADSILDLYSGVGSIGLSVTDKEKSLVMVETDKEAAAQAERNIKSNKHKMIISPAEDAINYITGNETVIVDPPRAGLHKSVTAKLINAKPQNIVYLSCNPATQARDIKELISGGYKIVSAQGFNFFPRTPHIESLIFLSFK